MCISDQPPTCCDQTCGHLDFPSAEVLLSVLESLPQLPFDSLPKGKEVGEGRLFEQEALCLLVDSTAREALELAIKDPDSADGIEEQAEEMVLSDRSTGKITSRELLSYLYPSSKEPRYSLVVKSPAKNALLWQSTIQYCLFRVKVGIVDQNRKCVKLNCRLFLRIRLFQSTAPLQEITDSEKHAAAEVFDGRLSRVFSGDEDEIVFDSLRVVNGTLKFPTGSVFLVVECTNLPTIRVAIVENVKIRKENIS